ncbi:LysM peptidoglycan-binding domain-containing protein [Xylanivirga thermophila]|uniref:LysM peptidoglycan-binding domain-containing protein n=1 Tax=Xylanivirga thermophila TaxID=2496273 RepID=UPI001FB551DC|nr:LysM domain-containing protein [Xylanivirga thermophila]
MCYYDGCYGGYWGGYPGWPDMHQCPPNTMPYIIRSGDTFYKLAQRFNTTVEAIMAVNPGVDPQNLMIGQRICIPVGPVYPSCPPNTMPYIIRSGDTFYKLAQRFNTTVEAIMAVNPGVDPQNLMIGQRICIPVGPVYPSCPPGSLVYVIKSGDTLYAIARRFNTTVEAIMSANPGLDPQNLMVRRKICVPIAM